MHPTLGYLAFDPESVCDLLGIDAHSLQRSLLTLGCRLRTWDICDIAQAVVGKPYLLGAPLHQRASHFDCAGFTKWVFAHAGICLPRYTVLQFDAGEEVHVQNMQPGDLVFQPGKSPWTHERAVDGVGHVALVVGPDMCLHTTSHTGGVVEASLAKFSKRMCGARRILPAGPKVTAVELPKALYELTTPAEFTCVLRSYFQRNGRLQ